jgi:hypothetical protein
MDKEMGPFVSGCVIDTNILIYHLAGVLTDQAEASLADALESGSYISIITRIELLGWRKLATSRTAGTDHSFGVRAGGRSGCVGGQIAGADH